MEVIIEILFSEFWHRVVLWVDADIWGEDTTFIFGAVEYWFEFRFSYISKLQKMLLRAQERE
jgi:hypothetical protein